MKYTIEKKETHIEKHKKGEREKQTEGNVGTTQPPATTSRHTACLLELDI